jgi:hypothetical protein
LLQDERAVLGRVEENVSLGRLDQDQYQYSTKPARIVNLEQLKESVY